MEGKRKASDHKDLLQEKKHLTSIRKEAEEEKQKFVSKTSRLESVTEKLQFERKVLEEELEEERRALRIATKMDKKMEKERKKMEKHLKKHEKG